MHTGMPIEAAIEDRVESGGCAGVSGACQGVSQVVRILAGDVSERRAGETIGGVGRQGVRHRDSTKDLRPEEQTRGGLFVRDDWRELP